MVTIASLWLPILLSAVAVFVASSVIHMFLPYHKSDYRKLPSEDGTLDALRKFDLPAGDYCFPFAGSSNEMKDPTFQEKFAKGPAGFMTVLPKGPFAMGSTFVLWFLYCVAMGVVVAYVAGRALPAGAPCKSVFRFAGATAFASYGLALWQHSIWYKRNWMTTVKANVDAVIYALVTASLFGWLWPK
jgi:hypothetical protein